MQTTTNTINHIMNTFGTRVAIPARRTVIKVSAVATVTGYALAGIVSLRSINGYPDLLRSLKSELGINPSLRLISDGSKEGVNTFGKAYYLDNLVEVNIYPSKRSELTTYSFNDTLIHECRHIWQHDTKQRSEGPNFCLAIAKEAATYVPRNKVEALLLKNLSDDIDYLAYLMSWREVDARAYASWYLNEKPLGLDYEQPLTDDELFEDITNHRGSYSFVSEKEAFALMFQRFVAVEVRIKKCALARNR